MLPTCSHLVSIDVVLPKKPRGWPSGSLAITKELTIPRSQVQIPFTAIFGANPYGLNSAPALIVPPLLGGGIDPPN